MKTINKSAKIMPKIQPRTKLSPEFRAYYMEQTREKKAQLVEKISTECHLSPVTVRMWVSQKLGVHPRYYTTINKITRTKLF